MAIADEVRVVLFAALAPLGPLGADVAPLVREALRVAAGVVWSAAVVPQVFLSFQLAEPEAGVFVLPAASAARPAVDAVDPPGVQRAEYS